MPLTLISRNLSAILAAQKKCYIALRQSQLLSISPQIVVEWSGHEIENEIRPQFHDNQLNRKGKTGELDASVKSPSKGARPIVPPSS